MEWPWPGRCPAPETQLLRWRGPSSLWRLAPACKDLNRYAHSSCQLQASPRETEPPSKCSHEESRYCGHPWALAHLYGRSPTPWRHPDPHAQPHPPHASLCSMETPLPHLPFKPCIWLGPKRVDSRALEHPRTVNQRENPNTIQVHVLHLETWSLWSIYDSQ